MNAFIAVAGNVSTLRTTDTTVTVEPFPDRPHIVGVGSDPEHSWKNRAVVELPRVTESGGRRITLRWRFNRKASRIDEQQLALVYDCESPRMRLTWAWRARADFGPIEHETRVENLSEQEQWLPLFDSIRLDWQIVSGSPWQHMYIEKGTDRPTDIGTHFEDVAHTYRWIGESSTYAINQADKPREDHPIFSRPTT